MWSDLGYVLVGDIFFECGSNEILKVMSEGIGEEVLGEWRKEEEIFDDKWVKESRKKGGKYRVKFVIYYLEGLNWEVLVVDVFVVNVFCLLGGKIVVFIGLFKYFRIDIEIVIIIGYEVI